MTENLMNQLDINGIRTAIGIRTLIGHQKQSSYLLDGLSVSKLVLGPNEKAKWIRLPSSFTRKEIPVDESEIATPAKLRQWKHLDRISGGIGGNESITVDLLIGTNCLKALEPLEVIPSQENGPYAIKTALGWCVIRPIDMKDGKTISCNWRAVTEASSGGTARHHFAAEDKCQEVGIQEILMKLCMQDFVEPKTTKNEICDALREVSYEDKKFIKIMDEETVKIGRHYQTPLPFRSKEVHFPNNRILAESRLVGIKRRMLRDKQFAMHYKGFMEELLLKGYARESTKSPNDGQVWHLPHHGIYHPSKPNKIRVVFDCSVEYKGRCLNKELLPGPDLANQLIGLLLRFRKETITFMADIEKMYFQLCAAEKHQDFLRFLWRKDGDFSKELIYHVMCAHVFGGFLYGACSNYALKRTVKENEKKYGTGTAPTLRENFYVDDLLKSVNSEDDAIKLIKNVRSMCNEGGFNLTKFISNSKKVLHSIPETFRRNDVKDKDLGCKLPDEQALDILWNVEASTLGFKIAIKEKPLARRRMLSTLSSIYDPLGLGAPFLLKEKQIIQTLWAQNFRWDDQVPQDIGNNWKKWNNQLNLLKNLHISRCFKPPKFGRIKETSIHHFSDASDSGYGQASYLRLVSETGRINCCLLMGIAHVAPIKYITIQRMELVAATLSVKISALIQKELQFLNVMETFWTEMKSKMNQENSRCLLRTG